MAEAPALPFWTDAYLGDTQHLTLEEHGAYIKLLIIAWRSADTSIPDDDKRIATMLGISKSRWVNRLRPNIVVHPFFASFDGRLTQKRLTKEKKYVLKNLEQKSAAGTASALKKKETASTAVPTADTTAGQRLDNGAPTPIPIPTPKEVKEGTNVPKKMDDVSVMDPFDFFWDQYPRQRRGNKAKAKSAYLRALKESRATDSAIMDGLVRYVNSAEVANGYAKGAEAWLNDDRWESDYTTQAKSGGSQRDEINQAFEDLAKGIRQ